MLSVDVWIHTHRHGSSVHLVYRDSNTDIPTAEQVIERAGIDFDPGDQGEDEEYFELSQTCLEVPTVQPGEFEVV